MIKSFGLLILRISIGTMLIHHGYEKLAEVYRREKKYNDQIRVLKEWLKIDPDNNKPNEELKLAFKKTGRDEFEIDKDRCEKNPENFDYCFTYAENLINSKR